MAYPKRLLSQDEEVVLEFRPHWSRVFKELILSVAVVIVLVLLAVLFDFPYQGWVMVGIAVIWFLLVVRGFLAWWFTEHVITNERVIYRSGILSRAGKEIPLEVVNDVSFSQSALDRMISSGDLMIESAGEHGQSHYRDIPEPEEMQKVIYGAREARMLLIQRGGDAPAPAAPITKVQQLEILSRLHDEGKLSDAEFEAEKLALNGGDV